MLESQVDNFLPQVNKLIELSGIFIATLHRNQVGPVVEVGRAENSKRNYFHSYTIFEPFYLNLTRLHSEEG